ncbi:MAG: valyl-tRNA synthetase [Solirubrobacterales bacterium]|nr:valyl-tRNA synthetase [Solirubrobacterales bacterium]
MDEARRERLEATTRWEPAEVERRIFDAWYASGAFDPPPEGSPEENFSIAIPPPNVTGALHMGHALNGSVQDVLIRTRRMQGRNALWILGTDHAGIGTQMVVEKELFAQGSSRHDLGREAFVEKVWEWREQYGSQIVEQYKRLGASCDYERERFTLDEGYVRAVYKVFVGLYEKGLIYRDNYMVSWDPGTNSAISDLEVVNREVEDTLYEIDYPVEGSDQVLTVATVRPETMLADTAVAVHPNDERYAPLVGGHVVLPLVGRRLPIIADEHVDPEFATGALKITPGHDPNDFEIGRAHGLDEISAIGEDGRMTAEAGEFEGMTAAEAREAVVAALREQGSLGDEAPYTHSVPFSERSGERIEPLISLQWFCRMDELAAPAIEVVERDEVRIVPENYKRVYLNWMRDIRPWCVSRQLWWGHQIPVWYGPEVVEIVAESVELARQAAVERGLDPDSLTQETDVLDTWFSSALWPFATLGWPDKTPHLQAFYPTSVLTTAREIIFLWVARMVMMGIEFTEQVPFTDVPITSVIQAPDGRRMSKSLGTGIDPLDEIAVHGADAVRFGLLAMSSTQDVRYSEQRVKQGEDLTNKLWNASRLVLLNANPQAGVRPLVEGLGTVEDRWIVSAMERHTRRVEELIESYRFSPAALELYDAFWTDVCDWYLELVKPRLYEGDPDAAAVLLHVLGRSLELLHPFMPHVTEEIWSFMPGERGLLAVSPWPKADDSLLDAEAEAEMERVREIVTVIRRLRDEAGIKPGVKLLASSDLDGALSEHVANLARLDLSGNGGDPVATVGGGAVRILASGDLDAGVFLERIVARRAKLADEVARIEKKLSNDGFVAKAPPEVVQEERDKLVAYKRELESLEG